MAKPDKDRTLRITPDEAEEQVSKQCPYCKEQLDSADALACPHCGLPLRRRKRQRQVTSHGGHLARIVVHRPGHKDREIALSQQVTLIGRAAKSHIKIDSPFVSKEHAKIEFRKDGYLITDLDSTNGTRVNGQLLTTGKPYLLLDRDIIRLSDYRGNSIKLTYFAPSGYSWVADVNRAGQSYHLDQEISHIGRGFDADIILTHPSVSWFHAKITQQDGAYLIEDVSGHDDVFLNGIQLHQPQLLEQGDVIGIGPFNLIYQGRGNLSSFVAERNFNVEVIDLRKVVYGQNWLGLKDPHRAKEILRHVDLDINPREFVALVGSSGSGKSTLMKALIGLSPTTGGQVLINGDNLVEHLDIYRNMIGYVPQDDIIHLELPVRRALRYASQVRVPEIGPDEREKLIDEVLEKVGLTAQANTIVNDLSGGQRKRVSIAAELLADPWIFFLDEPTSGLDPGLEKLMMDTLRQLADEGRTVVLVTHATNHIVDHCDQVAFMTQGELAFFGPPLQAMDYFGVDNFPDIYTAISQPFSASTQSAGSDETAPPTDWGWGRHYRQSEAYNTYILHRRRGEIARPITQKEVPLAETARQHMQQFRVLARRYLDLIKADRLTLALLLIVMPLVALLLLLISNSAVLVGHSAAEINAALESVGSYTIAADTQRMLFMMALATTLLGVFGAGYEIIKEEAIYRRERMINLQILPYFASKFGVLGLFMGVQLALFLLALAIGLRFPFAGTFFWTPLEIYISLLLTVLAGIALGLFISAIASSKDMVTYLILIVILMQIVFSGAIFKLTSLAEPLSYLTITRWSLEALGISVDINSLNNLGQVRVINELDSGRGVTTLVKDVPTSIEFFVNFARNPMALIARWMLLAGHILVWSYLAIWRIQQKDEIGRMRQ